jgi:hypothetical protein
MKNRRVCGGSVGLQSKGMVLARFAMRVAEMLFLFGLAGSAVVVVITFIEDATELFGKE